MLPHSRGKRGGIFTRVAPQDKAQRVEGIFRWKQIREGHVQEKLLDPKGLDPPACSPDIRLVRNTVRVFHLLADNLCSGLLYRPPYADCESGVGQLFRHPADYFTEREDV